MLHSRYIEKCEHGDPARDEATGDEMFCGQGPSRQECPEDYECSIHPTDRWAVCCPTAPPTGATDFIDYKHSYVRENSSYGFFVEISKNTI